MSRKYQHRAFGAHPIYFRFKLSDQAKTFTHLIFHLRTTNFSHKMYQNDLKRNTIAHIIKINNMTCNVVPNVPCT